MSRDRRPIVIVNRRLSIFSGVIAVGWITAAIVGASKGNVSLLVFGLLVAVPFAVFAWWLVPKPPTARRSERTQRRQDQLNRWFRRIGLGWAVDPDWRDPRKM